MTWLRSAGLRMVLALMLAFALWVFVSYTQNPDRRTPFDNVPVEIEGLTPGLVIVDANGMPRPLRASVRVTVEADTDTLENIRPSDLRAFMDLSGRGPGEHVLPIGVKPTRTDIARLTLQAEPDRLPVRLEQEITRTVELTMVVTGIVPFGFEARAARVTSAGKPVQAANVRGPQNRVERVAYVRATADIDRLTANYNSPRPLEPITTDGQVVQGVTVLPIQVDMQVPIVSSVGIKRVPVVPQISGRPASGYVVTDVSVDPQLVTLTGSSGPLDNVQNIVTQLVDVSGISQPFTRTVTLNEPANARLRAGEPSSAVVTVEIQPIARSFQVTLPVAVQVTGIPNGFLMSFNPAVVQVTLAGRSSQLAQIGPDLIQGTADVRGLGEGTHTLPVALTLPQGVTLVGIPPQVNVVLRLPPTPTPTPTPEPTPEPTPTLTLTPETRETPTVPPETRETPTSAPAPPTPTSAPAPPTPTSAPAPPTPTSAPAPPTSTSAPAP